MMPTDSESDVTSVDSLSSTAHSRPPIYYLVRSPPSSRDSNDDEKSSSIQTSPLNNTSPIDSPLHSSLSSFASSTISSVSAKFRWSEPERKRRFDKGWSDRNVIKEEEEEDDDESYGEQFGSFISVLGFSFVFTVSCFIIWGAGRPFKPEINVQNLSVHKFDMGEGSDLTGVPTKLLSVSCSVNIMISNPATFFGIHLSFSPVNLMFSDLTLATAEVENYYQPRKSHQPICIQIERDDVPLYGAGPILAHSNYNGRVPITLVFDFRSQGDLVGRLVKSKHTRHVSCSLSICPQNNQTIKIQEDWCSHD